MFSVRSNIVNITQKAIMPDSCASGKTFAVAPAKIMQMYSNEEVAAFDDLLTRSDIVKALLRYDVCNVMADDYLLATAFTYMVRQKLPLHTYNDVNFLRALLLAHCMLEDSMFQKAIIIKLLLELEDTHKLKPITFFNIMQAMDFKCFISKKDCQEVMLRMPHPWNRERNGEIHGQAVSYSYTQSFSGTCLKCYFANKSYDIHAARHFILALLENRETSMLRCDWFHYTTSNVEETDSDDNSISSYAVRKVKRPKLENEESLLEPEVILKEMSPASSVATMEKMKSSGLNEKARQIFSKNEVMSKLEPSLQKNKRNRPRNSFRP